MSQARINLECELNKLGHEVQCALSGYTACVYREMAGEDCTDLKARYNKEHDEAIAKRKAVEQLILDLDV